jgi:hypothetical protein
MQGGDLDPSGAGVSAQADGPEPTLVVTGPAGLRGQSFALDKEEQTLGRAAANDVQLEDPYVSRRHAVIRRAGSAVILEDSGSSAGTVVNDVLTTGPTLLHSGDRIRLGDVELEFLNGPKAAAQSSLDPPTAIRPAPPPPPAPAPAPPPSAAPTPVPAPPPSPAERRFDIDSQRAAAINNVAGNQYNEYALRIEPMRRRARLLLRVGLALLLAGLVISFVGFVTFAEPIFDCIEATDPSACETPDASGWLGVAFGSLLSSVGLIVIIVSLFMRRRARKEEERL